MVRGASDKWSALDMFEGMRSSTEDERAAFRRMLKGLSSSTEEGCAAFERMLKGADEEEFCDIFESDACDIEVDG